MKVKVKVHTLYGYDTRECRLTVDFKNDFKDLVNFLSIILMHNYYLCYDYFTPRQRSRIVGIIQKITIDKFIN